MYRKKTVLKIVKKIFQDELDNYNTLKSKENEEFWLGYKLCFNRLYGSLLLELGESQYKHQLE